MSKRTVFSSRGVEILVEETLNERIITVILHDALDGFSKTSEIDQLKDEIVRRLALAVIHEP